MSVVTMMTAEICESIDQSTGQAVSVGIELGCREFVTDSIDSYRIALPAASPAAVSPGTRPAGRALMPGQSATADWLDPALTYRVTIGASRLEALAARICGDGRAEPVRLAPVFELGSARAQSLLATVGFLHSEEQRSGGSVATPLVREDLENALLTQILLAVPNQHTVWLDLRTVSPRNRRIMEVLDLVEDDPLCWTTEKLARRLGVSVRALQVAFHEVVGSSPSMYLRGARLDRVHRDLLAGRWESVTEAAAQWGFFHPGRFAQQYRDRFGCLPSQTAGNRSG